MSKFINSLHAVATGRMIHGDGDEDLNVSVEVGPPGNFYNITEFRLVAKFSVLVGALHQEDIKPLLRGAARQLRKGIYGDLYGLLYSLERALYARNYYDAQRIMKKIWQEVRP